MPNEEKQRVILTKDIRYLRGKIKRHGRKGLTAEERRLAVSLGIIPSPDVR